jgi:serine/threonine protein kinase
MLTAGDRLDDRYEVVRVLGSGGFGVAVLANDQRLRRQVVIKVLRGDRIVNDEARRRFEREIDTLAQLQHAHIVKVLDGGVFQEAPYVVLEYLAGGSLQDRLQERGGRQRAEEVLGWLLDMAQALDFIHRKGRLHRDVKPENILFDAEGAAFLADFGIAKAEEETVLTREGTVPGTPPYMGPECLAPKKIDRAYDQYALGVVAYLALAGRLPYEYDREHVIAHFYRKQKDPPQSLHDVAPEVPERAAAAVQRALSAEPDQRFASCVEFARALERGLLGEPTPLHAVPTPSNGLDAPTTPVQPPTPPPRWRKWVLSGLLAGLALGGAYLAGFRPGPRPAPGSMQEEQGRLVVRSVPPGAKVVATDQDGRRTEAQTPAHLELLTGDYEVEVVRAGYRPDRRSVRVHDGREESLEVELERIPAPEPTPPFPASIPTSTPQPAARSVPSGTPTRIVPTSSPTESRTPTLPPSATPVPRPPTPKPAAKISNVVAPPAVVDVSGTWQSPLGLRYILQQQGNQVMFQEIGDDGPTGGGGQGTINGYAMDIQCWAANGALGRALLQVSPDGRQISGTLTDSSTGISVPALLDR